MYDNIKTKEEIAKNIYLKEKQREYDKFSFKTVDIDHQNFKNKNFNPQLAASPAQSHKNYLLKKTQINLGDELNRLAKFNNHINAIHHQYYELGNSPIFRTQQQKNQQKVGLSELQQNTHNQESVSQYQKIRQSSQDFASQNRLSQESYEFQQSMRQQQNIQNQNLTSPGNNNFYQGNVQGGLKGILKTSKFPSFVSNQHQFLTQEADKSEIEGQKTKHYRKPSSKLLLHPLPNFLQTPQHAVNKYGRPPLMSLGLQQNKINLRLDSTTDQNKSTSNNKITDKSIRISDTTHIYTNKNPNKFYQTQESNQDSLKEFSPFNQTLRVPDQAKKLSNFQTINQDMNEDQEYEGNSKLELDATLSKLNQGHRNSSNLLGINTISPLINKTAGISSNHSQLSLNNYNNEGGIPQIHETQGSLATNMFMQNSKSQTNIKHVFPPTSHIFPGRSLYLPQPRKEYLRHTNFHEYQFQPPHMNKVIATVQQYQNERQQTIEDLKFRLFNGRRRNPAINLKIHRLLNDVTDMSIQGGLEVPKQGRDESSVSQVDLGRQKVKNQRIYVGDLYKPTPQSKPELRNVSEAIKRPDLEFYKNEKQFDVQRLKLQQRMEHERDLQNGIDPTKVNIESKLTIEQLKEIRKKQQNLKDKQMIMISQGIIQTAMKEMRERYKQLIKKAIFAQCMKVYFHTGKRLYELNQHFGAGRKKSTKQVDPNFIQFGQEVRSRPLLNLKDRISIKLRGNLEQQPLSKQSSKLPPKSSKQTPQIQAKNNALKGFFDDSDKNLKLEESPKTNKSSKNGKRSGNSNSSQNKVKDFQSFFKEQQSGSSLLKSVTNKLVEGQNTKKYRYVHMSQSLLPKSSTSLKGLMNKTIGNSNSEKEIGVIIEKTDESTARGQQVNSEGDEANSYRFVVELNQNQEERNGIFAIMEDPLKVDKQKMKKELEKQREQEIELKKQRELEYKRKLKLDRIKNRGLLIKKNQKSSSNVISKHQSSSTSNIGLQQSSLMQSDMFMKQYPSPNIQNKNLSTKNQAQNREESGILKNSSINLSQISKQKVKFQ
eukprot:403342442